MVDIGTKLKMFSGLTRNRSFMDPKSRMSYTHELADSGIDIVQELVNRLRRQKIVTFYDIGCGDGLAADGDYGIFTAVSQRLGHDEQDLVQKLFYIGIDLIEPQSSEGPQKKLMTCNIEEFGDVAYQLPRIDVGVSLWSFPYFERKFESLESLVRHLNPTGVIVLCPFREDLTIVSSERGTIQSMNAYRQCFDASMHGSSLVLRGIKRPVNDVVSFERGELDNICKDARNGRGYAQIFSSYRMIETQTRTV